MDQKAYRSVCKEFRLPDGKLWPIPIYFDVSREEAKLIEKSGVVAIKDFNDRVKGYLHVTDIYDSEKEMEHKET